MFGNVIKTKSQAKLLCHSGDNNSTLRADVFSSVTIQKTVYMYAYNMIHSDSNREPKALDLRVVVVVIVVVTK